MDLWLKMGDLKIVNDQTNGEEIKKDLRDEDEVAIKEYIYMLSICPFDIFIHI
jgi:hypothetical protein